MPFRRRNRGVDLSKKEGPEFDYWLKSNISGGFRDWYRTEQIDREKWLQKLSAQVLDSKPTPRS